MNRRDFGRLTAGVLTALVTDPLQLADVCAAPALPWHKFTCDYISRYAVDKPFVQDKLLFATDCRWLLRAEAQPWQSNTEGIRLPPAEKVFQQAMAAEYGPWCVPADGVLESEEFFRCDCRDQSIDDKPFPQCEDCHGKGKTRMGKTRLCGALADDDRLATLASLPNCEIRVSSRSIYKRPNDGRLFHFRCTGAEGLLMPLAEK